MPPAPRPARRRARPNNPTSTPCSISQERLKDLRGTHDAVSNARHGNVLAAQQRSVAQKEFKMTERRARRMGDVLCVPGSRRARPSSTADGAVDFEINAEGTPGGQASKRQRVDPDPDQDLVEALGGQTEHHMSMDVDVMRGMDVTPHPELNQDDDIPFSPPAISPSRRPWQLRQTPETRPDEHGNLTRQWVPPVSPYGLIEEDQMIFSDPFKLLVVCQLLNKTGATLVRHVVYREKFFDTYPSPKALMDADQRVLEAQLKPLGLWKKRSAGLKRFAREYHELFWDVYSETYKLNAYHRVGDLYGCGEYAVDAVRGFDSTGAGCRSQLARSSSGFRR